ncbi:MAG: type II secretion system minor pseudopilin GspK [Pseudomonadales bacterium]
MRRGDGGRQRGVVLLSVLLILALLSALVYQLVGRQSLVVAQARQTFAGDQALQYALGAEAFARQILRQEWEDNGPVDNLTEVWAQPLPPLEVDNGFLEIQVRDLNGCFNLNSVASGETGQGGARVNLTRFKTLLRNLNLPDSIGDAWLDWIDPDQEVTGFGAEDGEYLLGEYPHRTADRLAVDVSELRVLNEMDRELYAQIEPYVCVLPTEALKLNVNTASPTVIAALNPTLAQDQLEAMTQTERTYTDVNQVTQEYPELTPARDALTVASEYFEIQVRAQVDDSLVELSSVLHRSANDGTITLLTRDFGKSFRSRFQDDAETDTEG